MTNFVIFYCPFEEEQLSLETKGPEITLEERSEYEKGNFPQETLQALIKGME
jgi:hypothetical protein